ncbi:MAG: hypothetical protein IJY22_00360, partial [Clostridia bacterium]|nr:hypothetical protein [Clostridia bacterium]
MKKRILACLLTLCLMVGLISAFGLSASAEVHTYTVGAIYRDGAVIATPLPGDRVVVSSAEDLHALAAYTNAGGATAHITFLLTGDIVLNDGTFATDGSWNGVGEPVPFTPIGEEGFDGTPFYGIFDGNGYTVSGLYINAAERGFVGLFGHISGSAVIRNLKVTNSYVVGDYYVGGIVGLAKMNAAIPVVNNCSFEGYVRGEGQHIGGIMGGSYGSTIVNCTNNGTVTGGTVAYGMGGILGFGKHGTATVQVIHCLITGSVGTGGYHTNIGGIVGYTEGTVSNCVNVGQISNVNRFGAILGIANDTVTLTGNHYMATNNLVGVGNTSTDDPAKTL